MKALTICEPFASLVVHGPKRVENRPRPTHYRGPLLIHAGKGLSWFDDPGAWREEWEQWRRYYAALPAAPTFGAVVGVADVAGCVLHPNLEVISHDQQMWASGPYCWLLENVRAFRQPVPCRGALSLWDVTGEILERCQRQLGVA
jgi:hypothetical protein